jgi:pilus assembly protein Flp/PilA
MLKFYIKAREAVIRLRTDNDGVVSFEYVIVAALVVGAVALAFGNSTNGIAATLTTALGKISTAVNNAIPTTPAPVP